MRKSVRGFTIVELLIVIVVIGILAAITIVAYNGVQKRALNTSRLTEVEAWQKQLLLYYANNGTGVDVASGNYCLGYGFPSGKCRNYTLAVGASTYAESANAALMTELKSASGSLPTGNRQPIGSYIGPYVNIWAGNTGFSLFSFFDGGATSCPSPMVYSWDSGAGAVLCQQDVSYS
jgi:prepilin-type N-terminal cleavage/methylation domain-containing protein